MRSIRVGRFLTRRSAHGGNPDDEDAGRGSRPNRIIDYLKLFGAFIVGVGGLITVFIGIVEYADHNEQDRENALFNSMQIVAQGRATIELRKEIEELITPFSRDAKFLEILDNTTDPERLSETIDETLFANHLHQHLRSALSFLATMYEYSKTSACAWKIVHISYSQDAVTLAHYFSSILARKPFTPSERPYVDAVYVLAYGNPPPEIRGSSCQKRSLVQTIKDQLDWE
jgi:hypothetical protein